MRITWIDSAKAYGIALVFYGHILESLTQLQNNSLLLQYKLIYAFHMPLFFILSGYLSKNSKLNFRYRLASRIVPVLFFNLLAFPFKVIEDIYSNKFFHNIGFYLYSLLSLTRGYPMFDFMTWFLVCLFTVESIDFLLRRYIKTNKGLIVATICLYLIGELITLKPKFFTFATGISVDFWYANEALIAYLFYQFGSTLKRSEFLETKTLPALQIAILIFTGLFFLFTFNLNSAVNMAGSRHGNLILFPLTAIAGSLFVILIAKLVPANKIIIFIDQNTLILLGINGFFVHFMNEKIASWIKVFLSDSHLIVFEICGMTTLISMILSIPAILILNKFIPQLVGKPRNNGPILKSFDKLALGIQEITKEG